MSKHTIKTVLVKDQTIARWNVSTLHDNRQDSKKKFNTGTIRVLLRSRRLLQPTKALPTIDKFKCISCFAPHNVFERNIRGRILRGYLVVVNGRTTIKDFPIGTGKPAPCYHNGRLCEACFPKYTVRFDAPDDYKSIQLIKDFVGPVTKRDLVTTGTVEVEDKLQEIAVAADLKDARPKRGKRIVIEVGKNLFQHHLETTCTVCSNHDGSHKERCSKCNAPTESVPATIHPNAFRKFMQSRKGGAKNYDMEVNFSNQKKG